MNWRRQARTYAFPAAIHAPSRPRRTRGRSRPSRSLQTPNLPSRRKPRTTVRGASSLRAGQFQSQHQRILAALARWIVVTAFADLGEAEIHVQLLRRVVGLAHFEQHQRHAGRMRDHQQVSQQEPCHPLPPLIGRDTDIEDRSEEHTSELQSLMRISYAVFCLKKKNT